MKISLAMIGVAALVLAGLLVFNDDSNEPQSDTAPTSADTADLLVRDDSPRLSKGGEAVFVEFLDFECEGCLSLYPVIEDLRKEYGDMSHSSCVICPYITTPSTQPWPPRQLLNRASSRRCINVCSKR